MLESKNENRLVIASTGAANLASVLALCKRVGVEAEVTVEARKILDARRALLPGVGAFGAAMETLRQTGMAEAFATRISRGDPTMGICLGMQLFFETSEETPGVKGIGAIKGNICRFRSDLPLPQLGWNRVAPPVDRESLIEPGWAYFANSYRLAEPVEGMAASMALYGETFVAALESAASPDSSGAILLCQFHPELSGAWGARLFEHWLSKSGGLR